MSSPAAPSKALPPELQGGTNPDHLTLTPESTNFLKLFGGNRGDGPKPPKSDPTAARHFSEVISRHTGGPYLSVPCVEDIPLPTLDDPGVTFTIRVYWPYNKTPSSSSSSPAPVPVLLYAHGGGYLMGSIGSVDQLCRRLLIETRIAVVSVDYRLSPEHRFPQHLNDMEAAYQWICQRPQYFDLSKIFTGGDSAGGNLTAALSVRLSHSSSSSPLPLPLAQLLIYPHLDCTCSAPSYHHLATGYGLDYDACQDMIADYLGPQWKEEGGGEALLPTNPEASPLLAPDPTIFPPTLLLSAEADILIGDAYAFKARLEESAVPVEHVVYRGLIHGFLVMWDTFPEAAKGVACLADYIRRKL